jgi:hypothetical protein
MKDGRVPRTPWSFVTLFQAVSRLQMVEDGAMNNFLA